MILFIIRNCHCLTTCVDQDAHGTRPALAKLPDAETLVFIVPRTGDNNIAQTVCTAAGPFDDCTTMIGVGWDRGDRMKLEPDDFDILITDVSDPNHLKAQKLGYGEDSHTLTRLCLADPPVEFLWETMNRDYLCAVSEQLSNCELVDLETQEVLDCLYEQWVKY